MMNLRYVVYGLIIHYELSTQSDLFIRFFVFMQMNADIEPDINSIQDDANLEKLQINEETVNKKGEKVGTLDFELLKVLGNFLYMTR